MENTYGIFITLVLQVWFSEVSPRPHDTGLVTLISQDMSEFALHARAILGLPIPEITSYGPSASAVLLVEVFFPFELIKVFHAPVSAAL